MFTRSNISNNMPRLRRSNSVNSLIPVVAGHSGLRQRSKSVIRDSGLGSRNSGLLGAAGTSSNSGQDSRKSQIPIRSNISNNMPRLRRSNSANSITPVVAEDSSGHRQRSKSFIRNSGLGSRNSGLLGAAGTSSNLSRASGTSQIQSASKNDAHVNDAFHRVQLYIENSRLFKKSIVNRDNIRPPSQTVFIHIAEVLFQQIFRKVTLTKENFKEETLRLLKLVKCPVNVTLNTLKIVSHMNSWPKIITMFDWLISIIPPQNIALLKCDDEASRKRNALVEVAINYFNSSYALFNANKVDKEEELLRDTVRKFAQVLGFDERKYNSNKLEIDQLTAQRDNLRRVLEQKQAQLEEVERNFSERSKKAQDLRSKIDDLKRNPLDVKLAEKRERLKKALSERDRLKSNVEALKSRISGQKYSVKDVKALQLRITVAKKELEMEKEQFEEIKCIKDELDEEIVQHSIALPEEVKRWNTDVMKTYYDKPEILDSLLLRQKAFHDPTFMQEVEAVAKKKEEIELQEKYQTEQIAENVKQCQRKVKLMRDRIEELQSKERDNKLKIKKVDALIENCELDILQIQKEWKIRKAVHDKKLEEMQAEEQSYREKIEKLMPIKLQKEAELERFQIQCIDFLRHIQKENTKCLQAIEKMREEVQTELLERCKRRNEEAERLLAELEEAINEDNN